MSSHPLQPHCHLQARARSHDHGHDHGHGHSHDHTAGATERALWIALGLNGAFLIVEVVVGLMANSLALLSDAGHMVSDVFSLALALVAQKLARREVNREYTFGLRRVPVLGALINAASLLVIVALIFREAVARMIEPPPVEGLPVLVAGVLGLAINVASAWYLHRSSDESVNIRGAMLHMIADALGSVAAIGSAVVVMTVGWVLIDPILSVLIGGLILYSTWPLLRETVNIVLQRAPKGVAVDEVRETFAAHPLVTSISDLHVWELNSGQYILSAVLMCESDVALSDLNSESDELRHRLEEQFGIVHATLEWRDPARPCRWCDEQ